MKFHHKEIDIFVKQHIEDEIAYEVGKNIEDLIFFTSHTICLKVFKEGTRKLKKMLKQFKIEEVSFLKNDIQKFIIKHNLSIEENSPKYQYLAKSLLKAQITINEAIMEHFTALCKGAHDWDYLEKQASKIYNLLCENE